MPIQLDAESLSIKLDGHHDLVGHNSLQRSLILQLEFSTGGRLTATDISRLKLISQGRLELVILTAETDIIQ